MKRHATWIAGFCAPFILAFVVASHSAVREGVRKLRVRSNPHVLFRDLPLDEMSLARDFRHLRRDLRRQVSLEKIFEERNNVLEDWHQIMRDRNPRNLESGVPMMELAHLTPGGHASAPLPSQTINGFAANRSGKRLSMRSSAWPRAVENLISVISSDAIAAHGKNRRARHSLRLP
jgi:hypothetical protein